MRLDLWSVQVQGNHHVCVTKLIEAQCNIDIYDQDKLVPLDVAIRNSYRGCINALLMVRWCGVGASVAWR